MNINGKIQKVKYWKWPLIAVSTLLINYVFSFYPSLVENIYFRGIFQFWRIIYDYTLGWLPFGSVYLLFIFLLYILYFVFISPWRKAKDSLSTFAYRIINLFSIFIFLFYILWGFNYQRSTIAEQVNLATLRMTPEELLTEVMYVERRLLGLRQKITSDTISISENSIPIDLESQLRKAQEEILQSWGFPIAGRVRIRKLVPKGILLRISTAGVYIPFASEGHIDKGLHPVQWPFTMAHEMGHGYGTTDEGECNFLAFITCMNSDNTIIQYSGWLGYYRYMLSNYRKYNRKTYSTFFKRIPEPIKKDIIDINNELDKYPDFLPEVRDAVYDQYLRSHGVKGGMQSYSTIIKLIHQWKNSDINQELVKRTFASLIRE